MFILKSCIITVIAELFGLLLQFEKNPKIYLLSAVINLVTNPLMNYLLLIIKGNYALYLWVFEIAVVIIEGLLYFLVYKKLLKSVRVSLILNIISFLTGIIIY